MINNRHKLSVAILTIMMSLLLAAGCSMDSNPIAPLPSDNFLTPLPLVGNVSDRDLISDSDSDAISQAAGWVSPESGGSVSLDFFTVVVPPNAVAENTLITITRNCPNSATVDLGPDGIQFATPVTLRTDLDDFEDYLDDDDIEVEDLVIALFDEESGTWTPLFTTVEYDDDGDPEAVSAQTEHFSRYALAD